MWEIISHVGITLAAVVTLALRLEHRLTKIETDVSWLKTRMNLGQKGDCQDEGNRRVDKA
ncbi:MAG: hypothetical protein WAV28_18760 [Sedimentisphaerales bacterium]